MGAAGGWRREECRIRWPFVDMDAGQIGPFLTPKGFTVGGVCRTLPLGDADTDVNDADAKIGFHCICCPEIVLLYIVLCRVTHVIFPQLIKTPSHPPQPPPQKKNWYQKSQLNKSLVQH